MTNRNLLECLYTEKSREIHRTILSTGFQVIGATTDEEGRVLVDYGNTKEVLLMLRYSVVKNQVFVSVGANSALQAIAKEVQKLL